MSPVVHRAGGCRRASAVLALLSLAACTEAPVAPRPRPSLAVGGEFLTVSNTNADGDGSLRKAVAYAEASPGPDTILFAIPTTDPGCVNGTCTITLGAQLEVASPDGLTIDGTGAQIVVSGGGAGRVFALTQSAVLTLKSLSVADGNAPGGTGGGILSFGILTLNNVSVERCTATYGGAIYSLGTLKITRSTVRNNVATYGGALATQGETIVTETTVADNRAGNDGGAAWLYRGTMWIIRSTLQNNIAGRHGGAFNSSAANVNILSSTITGSKSLIGNVLWVDDSFLAISNSTVHGNNDAGSVAVLAFGYSPLALNASVLSGGCAFELGYGFTAVGPSLVTRSCGSVSANTTDPGLLPLADNGGPTWTMAPDLTSPARNAVPVGINGCGTPGETDQRGTDFARLVGWGCDIGAVEVQVLPIFGGFLAPVRDGVLNRANSGRVLPVKFSLGGDYGLTPFVDGFPTVTTIACASAAAERYVVPTSTISAKASTLNYDATAGQYTYLWATEKAWAGTCKRLTLRFTGENVTYSLDVEFVN